MPRIFKNKPLRLMTGGVPLDPKLRERIPSVLTRMLERYARNVTRVAVRFEDINGPRGGIDTVCRIDMSVKGTDAIVAEARGLDATRAFRSASGRARTALRRAMERRGPA